jgi:membrane-bound lytic murein transglycosylase F
LHQLLVALKKHFYLGLFIVLVAACSGDPSDIDSTVAESTNSIPPVSLDLTKILERGYINAAVNYSSATYFVYRGELMGFEYELLKRLENYFNIKVNIIVQPSIEESMTMLNKGEVDIIAFPLTITKERKKVIAFTNHYISQMQVLVQRKPENWRDMKLHEIDKTLIRDQVELIEKEIHVLNHSSYIDALESLSDQIGGLINIIEDDPSVDTDQLIKNVADGKYKYTISDENIAKVNNAYYPILDIETPVSFPRRIAWAVRLNSPHLLDTLNYGIDLLKKTGTIKIIYDKYCNSSRKAREIAKSDYSSFSGGNLSPYDELIKLYAKKLLWDWRLLAAMVYQESKFDPKTTSWAGAKGLLQMMPATAREQGVEDRANPEQNLRGGAKYLLWLEKQWQPRVEDPNEQLKLVLASYNVGIGHVYDACALTEKFGGDPAKWRDVRENLLKLSNRKYYSDPVVKVGYARGSEPVNYVDEILLRYERYKQLIPQ